MSFVAVGVSVGLAVAGGAVKAIGDSKKAEAQAEADEFNASVKGQQAIAAVAQATEEARISRVQSQAFIGQQKANYGASGVSASSGSTEDILSSSGAKAELDALNIQHKGDMQAWALKNGASLDKMAAQNSRDAGGWAVAGDVIGVGSSAAGWLKD